MKWPLSSPEASIVSGYHAAMFHQNLLKGFVFMHHFPSLGSASHTIPTCLTSSPNSDPQDFDILSSTELSDGSFVFRFASANEIREKLDELNKKKNSDALNKKKKKLAREGVVEEGKAGIIRSLVGEESVENLNTEVDRTSGDEIESFSTVVVGVADQNPRLLLNEKEGDVLHSDSGTPVINDLQKTDRRLKLDTVEDGYGQQGILSEEDVDAESNGVPRASEVDSELDSHQEAVVSSTVATESDVVSDQKSDASAEVEEEEGGKNVGQFSE